MAEFETPSSLYWIYHASAFGFDFRRFRSHSERKGGKLSKYVSIPSSTVENLMFSLRGYSGERYYDSQPHVSIFSTLFQLGIPCPRFRSSVVGPGLIYLGCNTGV